MLDGREPYRSNQSTKVLQIVLSDILSLSIIHLILFQDENIFFSQLLRNFANGQLEFFRIFVVQFIDSFEDCFCFFAVFSRLFFFTFGKVLFNSSILKNILIIFPSNKFSFPIIIFSKDSFFTH